MMGGVTLILDVVKVIQLILEEGMSEKVLNLAERISRLPPENLASIPDTYGPNTRCQWYNTVSSDVTDTPKNKMRSLPKNGCLKISR
jgi:hypothetical protein